MLSEHPLEEVGPGVDLELPRRRTIGAAIERRDTRQVLEEIGAERRVDVDALGDAGIHLFLHEPGMEMSGINRHQPDLGHRAPLLARLTARRERSEYGNPYQHPLHAA